MGSSHPPGRGGVLKGAGSKLWAKEKLHFHPRYLLQYQEPIPCEQLVTALCDIKQAYTQFGGMIFGTNFIPERENIF